MLFKAKIYIINVTLDDKTSHKGTFLEIEMYGLLG